MIRNVYIHGTREALDELERHAEENRERSEMAFEEMKEAATEEAEQTGGNAFFELAPKAVDDHITFEAASIMPGFLTFTCDIDVYIGLYRIMVPAGAHLLKEGEEAATARVYDLRFDAEELIHLGDGLPYEETTDEASGVTMRAYSAENDEPLTFSASIEPIPIREGEFLTFPEYAAWLTMEVAPDDETREAIFNTAYKVTRETVIERDDDLPQQDTAKPNERQDPRTKIARLIGIPEKNAALYKNGGWPLNVAGEVEKRKGKDVAQVVAIEYMGADGIVAEGRERLTQLDRQVHNAIISHYVAGNRVVSLVQICEFVYGHAKPTAEQRRDVEECIERQMWTRISIDMTDESAKHDLKHPELLTDLKIEGQMLAIRKITARAANGKKIVAYQLMGEPILYTHAQVTGQILTYSTKLLQAPSGMNNTEKTMAIRQTLMEEINRAKNGKRSRFMKYETIYENSGQVPTSRTERNRQNNYVRSFLDKLIEHGEIAAWEERKEGRRITGFEITFREKPKTAARNAGKGKTRR